MKKGNILSLAFFTTALVLSATPLFVMPPNATPIDGGLSLVLGSCAVYGVKKIRDARKKN